MGIGIHIKFQGGRLPESNVAPENGSLEDEFPFGARPIFRGELLVSGGYCNIFLFQQFSYIEIRNIYIYIIIIPRTQMTIVLLGSFGLVLGGLTGSKIEVSWIPR